MLQQWLWFVIINRRGNCGLVRPGDDEGSKVDARETVAPTHRPQRTGAERDDENEYTEHGGEVSPS
jgi:hypothetical protein